MNGGSAPRFRPSGWDAEFFYFVGCVKILKYGIQF